jgi:hypothetical protein
MRRIKTPIGNAPTELREIDDGDAFRAQHQVRRFGEAEVEGGAPASLGNEAASPLGWLKSRKDRNGRALITDEQYQAGERLRADYWFAHVSPG